MRIASRGHAVFAGTLIVLGAMELIKGLAAPMWLSTPGSVPWRQAVVYLSALVAVGCGLGLLWRRSAAVASRVLLGFLLAWLLLLRVPYMIASFNVNTWFAAAETGVTAAAAWVLYLWFAGEHDAPRLRFVTGGTGLRIARALYGLPMIPFGIAHFMYIARTESLVPAWLPWHPFWAYFFGCTFIAAGLAVLVNVYARLAVVLSGIQMGMFTVLVWVPIMVAGTPTPSDWEEFVVSWLLTAAAWVVAESWRREDQRTA